MGTDKTTCGDHALLSASSSHRWMHCTPSAKAEQKYHDDGSDYAREGTLAHALATRALKQAFGLPAGDEEKEIAELEKFRTAEMDECVEDYTLYVIRKFGEAEARMKKGGVAPQIRIEQRLDFSQWVPEGFGTGDAVIISEGSVEVIDLKYGKGVKVESERNPQMMLYALGTIDLFDYAYELKNVAMTIFQPRIGHVSEWSMPVAELMKWAYEEVSPLARLAWEGKGVRNSGEWCRFCKAKGDCRILAEESLQLWQLNEEAEEINNEELGGILERLDTVELWVSAIKERALAKAIQGEKIKGWKMVEGRSVRKIRDAGAVAQTLALNGYRNEEIFRPLELRSLGEYEKLIGKKEFAELCGEFIEKPKGKPTLVRESDKRKSWNPADEFDI